MEEKFVRLRRFNLAMALLHFGQGVTMLFLAKDFKLPLSTGFLNFNVATQKLYPDSHHLFDLKLVYLIVAFLFISSSAHLIIATIYNKSYNENLAKGINKARWIEYAFSASTMMVAIAMLVGIYDLGVLMAIFALIAIMNLMGLVVEVHNQTTKQTDWLSFYLGCLAGIIPWIMVAIFFWATNRFGSGQIPGFVYWIYGTIFVFFNCFAFNMVLQYKKIGKWSDYLYGERAYIILSLVAKSALAWQVFAGTLRP
jgi:hypothetical protein